MCISLWVSGCPGPLAVSRCPRVSSAPCGSSSHGTNGGGPLFPRIWAAKRPARGAPEAAPADSGGRSVQRSPKARRSASQPAFAPRQNRRTDPFRVRRPFRTPIKGEGPRSAAWRPKRGGLRGEPGQGRLRRKHQATRGLTPQALHKGEGGPNSAKRNQPARGGRARRGISQGREPWGISRRAGRKGGNFPEYGNDRPTDPEDTAPPKGEALSNRGKRSLRGWGLWRRVWRLVAAGIRRTKRESPGRQVREFLRREPRLTRPGRRPVLVGGGKRDVLRAQALGNHARGIS